MINDACFTLLTQITNTLVYIMANHFANDAFVFFCFECFFVLLFHPESRAKLAAL